MAPVTTTTAAAIVECAHGQRWIWARFGECVDDLPHEPVDGQFRASDRAIPFRWFGRVRVTAGAVRGECVFRIRLVGLGRRNDFRIEVADEAFGMRRCAHLYACGKIDLGNHRGRVVFGVTGRAFKLVFVQALVRLRIGFGVEEFDAVFQRR